MTRFLSCIDQVDPADWNSAERAGKWSAAEVVEFLILYYEVGLRELAGGDRPRLESGSVVRLLLRWFLLPHILFHRSFPIRLKVPRDFQSNGLDLTRDAARKLLFNLTRRYEVEIERAALDSSFRLTHPYFGEIRPEASLRYAAVQLEWYGRGIG